MIVHVVVLGLGPHVLYEYCYLSCKRSFVSDLADSASLVLWRFW